MSDSNFLQQLAGEQTNTLQYQIEVGSSLSVESRLLPIIDGAKSTFNSFLQNASGFLAGLKVGNYKAQDVKLSKVEEEALRSQGYTSLRTKLISVPVGFSAKYDDYLKDVEKVLTPIESLEKTLKVSIVKLAQILNEPDRLKAQSGLRDLEKAVALVTTEQYEALMANYKNGERAQVALSAVADNLSEFTGAYGRVGELNHRLAKVDMVAIQGQINRMAELVGALHTTVSDEATKDVSGQVAGQLSDLIYRMGVTATVVSLVASGVGDLSSTMISNVKGLTAPVIAA